MQSSSLLIFLIKETREGKLQWERDGDNSHARNLKNTYRAEIKWYKPTWFKPGYNRLWVTDGNSHTTTLILSNEEYDALIRSTSKHNITPHEMADILWNERQKD